MVDDAFWGLLSLAGLGGASAIAQEGPTTIGRATVADGEALAGLTFTDSQRELMVDGVNANLKRYAALRSLHIPNEVPPAYHFDPVVPGLDADVETTILPPPIFALSHPPPLRPISKSSHFCR